MIPSEEFIFKNQVLSILRVFKNMKCGLLVKVSVGEKFGSNKSFKKYTFSFILEILPLEIKITSRNWNSTSIEINKCKQKFMYKIIHYSVIYKNKLWKTLDKSGNKLLYICWTLWSH